MEEALHPLETDQQTTPANYLTAGIALSVVLHLVCTAVLFSLPQGSPARRSVTYIDLNLPQHAAAPLPAQTHAAAREPEPIPVAQEPPLPDAPHPPEPPAPVAQAKSLPEQPPAPANAQLAEEPSRTTLGLGLTKGYFKSLGDGNTLREGVKGYYLDLLQKVNDKWWLDQQEKKRIAPVVINIVVARSGEIVDAQVLVSSGDTRYDRAVRTALAAAGPLPPLPASFEGNFFEAPVQLVPPLNLMSW